MDKKTLKSIIIEERLSGKPFSDISDELLNKYGVKMSRQAVCGMYNRTTSKNLDVSIVTTDICKYHALGLNIERIKSLINTDDIKLSSAKIEEVIRDNKEYIDDIKEDNIESVTFGLMKKYDVSEIISLIQYKNIKPTSKELDNLLELSTQRMVDYKIAVELKKVLDITYDNTLVNKFIKHYNLDMTISDIRNTEDE